MLSRLLAHVMIVMVVDMDQATIVTNPIIRIVEAFRTTDILRPFHEETNFVNRLVLSEVEDTEEGSVLGDRAVSGSETVRLGDVCLIVRTLYANELYPHVPQTTPGNLKYPR